MSTDDDDATFYTSTECLEDHVADSKNLSHDYTNSIVHRILSTPINSNQDDTIHRISISRAAKHTLHTPTVVKIQRGMLLKILAYHRDSLGIQSGDISWLSASEMVPSVSKAVVLFTALEIYVANEKRRQAPTVQDVKTAANTIIRDILKGMGSHEDPALWPMDTRDEIVRQLVPYLGGGYLKLFGAIVSLFEQHHEIPDSDIVVLTTR